MLYKKKKSKNCHKGNFEEIRKDKTEKFLTKIKIKIPNYSDEELINLACETYNQIQLNKKLNGEEYDPNKANPNSMEVFLKRICVNYLRHITSYDNYLVLISNKKLENIENQTAKKKIKKLVLEKIAKKYPNLKEECIRQIEKISWL